MRAVEPLEVWSARTLAEVPEPSVMDEPPGEMV